MKEVTLKPSSNEAILELIDKRYPYFLVHQFNPHEAVTWWQTDLKISENLLLNDVNVRNMYFDIKIDLSGLEKLIGLNTRQLRIYQFENDIPETLVIEYLPENAKISILQKNGLKHFYWINFEFLTISSFDSDFISSVNPLKNE